MMTLIALGIVLTNVHAASDKRPVTENTSPYVELHRLRKNLHLWCQELDEATRALGWTLPKCRWDKFKVWGESVKGRSLVLRDFGDPQADNTTLVLAMVHGDELTPLYTALKLIEWLEENPAEYDKKRVVIAPLVNPDGFYVEPRTRVNANGVDVNRNFGTEDWKTEAIKKWKRFGSNPRRFPGRTAESEPETLFQKRLIQEVNPTKILSVHAPLGFMDYDGPDVLSLATFPREYVKKCLQLQSRMRAVRGGFYPGSLGNYAGQERGIPTLTLELPSALAPKGVEYWDKFRTGLQTVIAFEVPGTVVAEKAKEGPLGGSSGVH